MTKSIDWRRAKPLGIREDFRGANAVLADGSLTRHAPSNSLADRARRAEIEWRKSLSAEKQAKIPAHGLAGDSGAEPKRKRKKHRQKSSVRRANQKAPRQAAEQVMRDPTIEARTVGKDAAGKWNVTNLDGDILIAGPFESCSEAWRWCDRHDAKAGRDDERRARIGRAFADG